jgi:hypothetical protein
MAQTTLTTLQPFDMKNGTAKFSSDTFSLALSILVMEGRQSGLRQADPAVVRRNRAVRVT